MSAPKPPVAFKDHCSIIHDGVIYVYSPDAFQTLELKEGAKWKEQTNGVSVSGAVCVKGGVDGDNSKAALYVVGGATNASTTDYSGLQRYSIQDKTWQTVVPVVNVTQNRLNHGAAYLDSSSTLVVYGGSQNGDSGPSSETFTIGLYPPYTVLAYSSVAPPAASPFMLPYSQDRTLMVGGSSTNDKTFTFDPINGWLDVGVTLPAPLPDHSAAQCALFTLPDGSVILQTFNLGQTPATVTTNVLLNPGGAPASFGQTAGGSSAIPSASPALIPPSKSKRQTSLGTYPAYNDTLAPSTGRTGSSLAQGDDGLVALIGGNDDNPLLFFNQSGNGWIAASQLLGTQQAPLTTPSSTPSSTVPPSSSTASTTPAVSSSSGSKTQGLTVLGAVLGGICGALAILLLLLLWLRSRRRKRRAEAEKEEEYPDDKKHEAGYNYEERGLGPLAAAGQPMGRSPVSSAYITEADTTGMLGVARPDPASLIRRVSSDRMKTEYRGSGIGFGQALFKREKDREQPKISISKPMMPILNDYKERPSIELGKATPVGSPGPAVAVPSPKAAVAAKKPSQRKTDEGWGKYFQADRPSANRATFLTRSSGEKSGFWPGSGNPESATRSPKFMLRDSIGNPLEAQNVAAGSPSLEHGPPNLQSRGLQSVQGMTGHISRASSVRTDSTMDDDYEDDQVFEGAFSSGVPTSVQETAWTPVGNTWSGPTERPLHPPSSYLAAQQAQRGLGIPQTRPQATASSAETSNTSDTQSSSIPSFPMPNSIRSVQPSGTMKKSTADPPTFHQQATRTPFTEPRQTTDYFSHGRKPSTGRQQPENTRNVNTDMSWLNLGTPSENPRERHLERHRESSGASR
ncbi:hypothetical protein G647_05862 [Cladophialophora carrionii CBS 160.54]|uniref:Pre-mRNA splicing factor CLF1 n=1 Tax=Cladophialophora carrionii CBS 160.54 TaxID=1279043 RepID=V9D662_9EURO|nr:uncharacterized protein G647_05862 [Cladophialophora carrionii CBS 160.54]ETI21793.1 hypothetical protein G647_05862 [Cladophialophora carrionii CBS 160.54]